MEWAIIAGIFLFPALLGLIYLWVERSWKALWVFVLLVSPLATAIRYIWLLLRETGPDPTGTDLAIPLILAGVAIAFLWGAAYRKDPKLTSDVTTTAAWGYVAYSAAKRYQRKRDRERATAVADEWERRRSLGAP